MDKKAVFKIISSRFIDLSDLALSYVNLSDNERDTLLCRARRGKTQEETAEILQRGKNTIQKWEGSACGKCCKTWSYVEWILILFDILQKDTD